MPQSQTALDYVLSGTDTSTPGPVRNGQTALDWVMGSTSEPSPASGFAVPDIGEQAKTEGAQPGPMPQTVDPSTLAGKPDPINAGLEDVVRGLELGAGAMAGTAGRALATARNVLAPGETTRAEQARRVQRAGGLGRSITEQAQTHPEPTTMPGKIMEGVGQGLSIGVPSMVNPALGAGALVATAGAGVEGAYQRTLKETKDPLRAAEAAVYEIPIQALYLAPLARIFGGLGPEGGTLLRKSLDAAASGAIGQGAARVVGEVVAEQVSKDDRAQLGEALRRGAAAALRETPQNAAIFGILGAISGAGETKTTDGVSIGATNLADRGAVGPEGVSNLNEGHSGGSHSANDGGVQAGPPVLADVGGDAHQDKVLNPVVGLDPVQVVNDLPSVQRSPEGALHDKTMLQNEPSSNREGAVASKVVAGTVERTQGLTPNETELGAGEASTSPGSETIPNEAPGSQSSPSGSESRARPPEGLPTSTKNAVTEQERAMRGEPPLEEALRKTWGTTLDTARAAMEKDPSLIQRIVEGKSTPELTLDEREAALGSEKVTTHNEYKRLRAAAIEEAGNPDAFKAIEEQRQKVSDRLLELDKATKASGRESARALGIRRMMLAEDYSIAAVETEFRLAKGGDRLTPEEMAKAEDLSRRLIAAEKQVEEIEGALAVKREAKAAVTKKANVLSFLDAQAEQARARLAAKRGRAGGGLPFDPQDILDVARIAASHIAHGIDAGVQLVKDFGEEIRPHLDAILAKAKQMHDEAGKRSGSEKAAITRATNTAAKLRAKTAAQDFEPEVKPEPLPMTPERLKAKADLEEARKEYETQKARFRFANRTFGQKARDVTRESLNVTKQLLTAYDLSATLFQGGWLSSNHPILSSKAFGESLRAFSNERKSLEIDTALRNREHFAEGEKAGLELTRLDGPLSAHEEHMRSNWAEKIPLLGIGVRASNRAFTTFLNVQRALSFDKMIEGSPDKSSENQKALANYINVATGRGYTPAKMRAVVSAASNVLWSPRLLISRFQLLAGQPMWRGTASSRKAIAADYAKSLIALGGVYTIAQLAGADVEKDPRSSAFGKIKLGNVYVDPLLGLSQVTHIISEVGSGQKKNAKGEVVPLRAPILEGGKGPKYGQSSTADELFSFLRKKFSPTIGVPLDILAGKNVVGQPVTPADLPQEMLVPLAFQDVYKAMRDGGVPEAVALGLLSVLGAHVEVHDQDRTPKLRLSGPSHAPPKR